MPRGVPASPPYAGELKKETALRRWVRLLRGEWAASQPALFLPDCNNAQTSQRCFLRVVSFSAAFHSMPRLAPVSSRPSCGTGDPEREAFERVQNAFPLAQSTVQFAECGSSSLLCN